MHFWHYIREEIEGGNRKEKLANPIFMYAQDVYRYYLVNVLPTLGSPTILPSGRVQIVCFGLWKQHNEDAESRAHTPARRVG